MARAPLHTSRPTVPAPQNVYGASKLLGDWFALEHPRAYVLRVESLFGEPGTAGADAAASAQSSIAIRSGERSARVRGSHRLAQLLCRRGERDARAADQGGAVRVVSLRERGAVSWETVARTAADLLGLPIRISPLTLETAALRASRPRYGALSTAKLAAAGFRMPSWQDALRRHLVTASAPAR